VPTRTRTRTGPGEAVPIRDGRSSTPTDQPAAREVSGAFTPEAIAVNVLDIHPQTTLSASGHHTLHPPFQIGLPVRGRHRQYTTTAPTETHRRGADRPEPARIVPDGNCRAWTGNAPAWNHTNAARYLTPLAATQPFNNHGTK